MAALLNLDDDVPGDIKQALQDALQLSLDNVPTLIGKTAIVVDVSGSMSGSVNGGYGSNASKIRYVDVAGLIASCILKKNPEAKLVCFDNRLHPMNPKSSNSVLENAKEIASFNGGSTNCALGMSWVADNMPDADNIIFISDSEANEQITSTYSYSRTSSAYDQFLKCKNAKLLSIDIQPGLTLQLPKDDKKILHVSGFNDQVFELMGYFFDKDAKTKQLVDLVNEVKIG
jgi:60 kDa SS-A/Ro ribonucleoprotein